jgi:hypothetical protein
VCVFKPFSLHPSPLSHSGFADTWDPSDIEDRVGTSLDLPSLMAVNERGEPGPVGAVTIKSVSSPPPDFSSSAGATMGLEELDEARGGHGNGDVNGKAKGKGMGMGTDDVWARHVRYVLSTASVEGVLEDTITWLATHSAPPPPLRTLTVGEWVDAAMSEADGMRERILQRREEAREEAREKARRGGGREVVMGGMGGMGGGEGEEEGEGGMAHAPHFLDLESHGGFTGFTGFTAVPRGGPYGTPGRTAVGTTAVGGSARRGGLWRSPPRGGQSLFPQSWGGGGGGGDRGDRGDSSNGHSTANGSISNGSISNGTVHSTIITAARLMWATATDRVRIFNGILDAVAEVLCSDALSDVAWPPPELAVSLHGSGSYGGKGGGRRLWNDPSRLVMIRKALLSIKLPPMPPMPSLARVNSKLRARGERRGVGGGRKGAEEEYASEPVVAVVALAHYIESIRLRNEQMWGARQGTEGAGGAGGIEQWGSGRGGGGGDDETLTRMHNRLMRSVASFTELSELTAEGAAAGGLRNPLDMNIHFVFDLVTGHQVRKRGARGGKGGGGLLRTAREEQRETVWNIFARIFLVVQSPLLSIHSSFLTHLSPIHPSFIPHHCPCPLPCLLPVGAPSRCFGPG